jgi:hypothetical protein
MVQILEEICKQKVIDTLFQSEIENKNSIRDNLLKLQILLIAFLITRHATRAMLNGNLRPLTNYEIINLVKELKIKNFRGIFMRDTLPTKINELESGIVNLDSIKNNGTHWVCYLKNKDKSYYFDSFGLDPPLELLNYLNRPIKLSTFQIQKFNTHHCGYYCLLILKLLEKYDYNNIIMKLF